MSYELKTNSKRVFDFYNTNNLNFELFNLLFIDILEQYKDVSISNIHALLDKKIDNIDKLSATLNSQFSDCIQTPIPGKSQIVFRHKNTTIFIDSRTCEVDLTDELVVQFQSDCEINRCNGILFSQNSGIVGKNDFEIQIHNKNVLLYVHNTNYDDNIIKTAITIVENLKLQLDMAFSENYTIDDNDIANINSEYLEFIKQKAQIMKTVAENGEKMGEMLSNLKLPNLDIYLSPIYKSSQNDSKNSLSSVIAVAEPIVCSYCNKTVPKSILQHYRHCKSKMDIDMIVEPLV
jgi:hypothetical protein